MSAVRRSVAVPIAVDVVSYLRGDVRGEVPREYCMFYVPLMVNVEGAGSNTAVTMSTKLKRSSRSCSSLISFHVL